MTDGHPSRSITYKDWDVVGDRLINRFVMSLAIKYGALRSGWDTMIKNCGGQIIKYQFVEQCGPLGIAKHEAEWLFAVLDTEQRRYLSEYDRLRFLQHWDPGHVRHLSLMDLKFATHAPPPPKSITSIGRDLGVPEDAPFNLAIGDDYQVMLVLNEEEHREYRRRVRSLRLATGLSNHMY